MVVDNTLRTNHESFDYKTLYRQALISNDLGSLKYIFDIKKISPTAELKDGKSFIHLACMTNNLKFVQYLVEYQRVDPSHKDRINRTTCMHDAAFYNAPEVLRYLVENRKVDVNIRDANLDTALMKASSSNNVRIVKYLLDHGADFKARNRLNKTALEMARPELQPMIRLLNPGQSRIFDPESYISKAFSNKDLKILKWLFDVRKVSANAPYRGKTLLHFAAEYGLLNFVEYLVEYQHLDPNARSPLNNRPIHEAAFYGSLSIVRYLVEKAHVDMNTVNDELETPLYKAVLNNQMDIVKYLVARGANLNVRTVSGQTVLNLAESQRNKLMIDFLKTKMRRYRRFVSNVPNVNDRSKREIKSELLRERSIIDQQVNAFFVKRISDGTSKKHSLLLSDLNETLFALNVYFIKVTGGKMIASEYTITSDSEVQILALNILVEMEKILIRTDKCAQKKEYDSTILISKIKSHLINGSYSSLMNFLLSEVNQICSHLENANDLNQIKCELEDYLSQLLLYSKVPSSTF